MFAHKAVVTGAYGFIGRHVARCLAGGGVHVVGIGHGTWSRDEWSSWGLREWFESDICLEQLAANLYRPDEIFHCAGGSSVLSSIEQPHLDFRRTVDTTAAVVEYIRTSSPETKLVYISSAAVYGATPSIPIHENAACSPISPYGVYKLMAEQLVAGYSANFSLSASIVRLFSVYGCGLRKQLLWDACGKLSRGDTLFMGTGHEIRDWLYVDDAARLVCMAAQHASSPCMVVNGGTGSGIRVQELLSHLGLCLLGRDFIPNFSDNNRAGDPSAYVADITIAAGWGWGPAALWKDRVAEYADWWRAQMSLPPTKPR